MFNQLKKQLNVAQSTIKTAKAEAEVTQSNAVIRVIGDRASGKTTYMAALARFPNANPDGAIQDITAIGDGNELISKAQNILEQGLELEPTDLQPNAENVSDYQLSITLKGRFSLKSPRTSLPGSMSKLNISCKDYAGEFFSDLLYQANDDKLTSYLKDCSDATGIMFLLDGSASRKDADYATGIEKFLKMIAARSGNSSELRRVALVLSKCELPELWMKRKQPKDLAHQQFKQVCAKLQGWESTTNSAAVEFFATSAFGVVGSRFPEANSKEQRRDRGGVTSVLKDTKHWRPFGLVSPIYWLCTGERHNQLDEE
jgi:hypothetical protein